MENIDARRYVFDNRPNNNSVGDIGPYVYTRLDYYIVACLLPRYIKSKFE